MLKNPKEITRSLTQLYNAYKYYNNLSEEGNFEQVDTNRFPPGYTYFIHNNQKYDELHYYNIWMFKYLNSFFYNKEDEYLSTILSSFSSRDRKKLRESGLLEEANWTKYLDRSHSTFMIEYSSSRLKVSMAALNIYLSLYENEEMLLYIYWIAQTICGDEEYKTNFKNIRYNAGKGKIIKGQLIQQINEKLKKSDNDYARKLKYIFNQGYNKNLRNIIGHNDAKINEDTLRIESIDNNNECIDFEEFNLALYTIQQIHNHIKFFVNEIIIEDKIKSNVGIFSCATSSEGILLYQLSPFYKVDQFKGKKMIEIKMVDNGDTFSFYSWGKEVIIVQKDPTISMVYLILNNRKLKGKVYSVKPNVLYSDSFIKSKYGEYIYEDHYQIVVSK